MPLGEMIGIAVVGSPGYFMRFPVPRQSPDLIHHNCVGFRFSGSGAIFKWELEVNDKPAEYEVGGNLTVSDSLFPVEGALNGVGLAYTFETLARAYSGGEVK